MNSTILTRGNFHFDIFQSVFNDFFKLKFVLLAVSKPLFCEISPLLALFWDLFTLFIFFTPFLTTFTPLLELVRPLYVYNLRPKKRLDRQVKHFFNSVIALLTFFEHLCSLFETLKISFLSHYTLSPETLERYPL